MSGIVILSALVWMVRRFPLLTAEAAVRMADFVYRQFMDDMLEKDLKALVRAGFSDESWPHHHCYRKGEVEFYTTTFRLGEGSFTGWRCRIQYIPDTYVEITFGMIHCAGTIHHMTKLADKLKTESSFFQMAASEVKAHATCPNGTKDC